MIRMIDLNSDIIKLGPLTLLTVDEGYSAITQDNGKQVILAGGHVHLLTHRNWKFEKFVSQKIETMDLQNIVTPSADNVLMEVDSTVAWQIVDVQRAATAAIATMSIDGGEISQDTERLKYDILKQAEDSLSMFIGTANYSSTTSHSAALHEAGGETPSGSASQHGAAEYGDALRSGALQRLPEADSLWAVQRELARHASMISLKLTVPAQDLRGRMGEADTVSDENIERLTRLTRRGLWSKELDLAFLESEEPATWGIDLEPNPVYVELKKLEARHGLALAVAEHRLMVGLESDRVSATQDMFVALLELYQVSRRQVSRLLSEVLALQAEVRDLEKGLLEQQTVIQRLNRLTLEQDRLTRTRETRQTTYDRLAKLAEEARIAAQIASANLRIITRAGAPVSEGEFTRQSVPLAGAIGLILSVFVAFVVEYVSKARARQAAGRN